MQVISTFSKKASGFALVIYFNIVFLLFTYNSANGQTIKTIGSVGGDYPTLKMAFDAVNSGQLTGSITFQLIGSTNESERVVLYKSGWNSNYSSILIYPTDENVHISGSPSSDLIAFEGADNVTIDGRVNATGDTPSLTIEHLKTVNPNGTIVFVNDASNNCIKYCNLKSTGYDSEVLVFATAALTGNDNNIIESNIFTHAHELYKPSTYIYSLGTDGKENSGNIIKNNNFKNFVGGPYYHSITINLFDGNDSWTISGNSFYMDNDVVTEFSSSNEKIIPIKILNTGTNYSVVDNYIGGTLPQCGGTELRKTSSSSNAFTGIYMNVGDGSASLIHGNTISNINWNSGSFIGIESASTGGCTITSNTITNLTSNSSNSSSYISGIVATNGINIISNNLIHSLNGSGNNISPGGLSPAAVTGIHVNFSSNLPLQIIEGNTIRYLLNTGDAFAGSIIGIDLAGAACNITRNYIHDFYVTNITSTEATITGINAISGNITAFNNIIDLGGDTKTSINGINETNTNLELWYNTVHLSGNLPSDAINQSSALLCNNTTISGSIKNNIFYNTRTGGSGKHYAAQFNTSVTNPDFIVDYNDYFAPGNGGVLGLYNGADFTSLPIYPSMDVHSVNIDPLFISTVTGGANNFYPGTGSLIGIPIPQVNEDYASIPRSSYPVMGAHESLLVPDCDIWTITGDTFACSNIGTVTLSINGNSGSVIKWQYTTDEFTTVTDIANTTRTLVATNLSAPLTAYWAVIGGECRAKASSIHVIALEEQATSGNLKRVPDVDIICESQTVSATLTEGSGGNGIDEMEYRVLINTGWSIWLPCSPGDIISANNKLGIEIRTRRLAESCDPSAYSTVHWNIEQKPITASIVKIPDVDVICENQPLSVTLIGGFGGNGIDELEYRTLQGTVWSGWQSLDQGEDISTTGKLGVEVRTRRMTSTCNPSSYSTARWEVRPTPEMPQITLDFPTLTFTSSAPEGNQWYLDQEPIEGATGKTYIASKNGNYSCKVTLAGCPSLMPNSIYLFITGTKNVEQFVADIYPIPNNGRFTLDLTTPEPGRYSISVFSATGTRMYFKEKVMVLGNYKSTIDLGDIPIGFYSIVIAGEGKSFTRKMVLSK